MDNNKEHHVVKRDGTRVPFDLAKWQAQIAKKCEGIPDISPSMIEVTAQAHFYDGMTTTELDWMALKAGINLIDEEEHPEVGHVNYQHFAGKQRISMLRKDVFGEYEPPRLYDIVVKNVGLGLYTDELLTWYTESEWDQMEKYVDHDKDEGLPYAAVEQLIDKYLVQDRSTGAVYETPQVRYIVAAATAFHAEKKDRLKYVRDFYQSASDGLFTMATPVLAGLGTPTKQFSSCVLIRSDDTLDSIFAAGEMMGKYASKRAGIGLDVGRIRPLGAPIRNGQIKHTGMVPFLKKWFGDLRCCSQGGIRNSSATVNYPIWHYQFEDLIVLKNNKGTEETRVRHMDYAVAINAFFYRRLKAKGNITLFDPNDVPDLYEAFYRDTKEFERLYVKYEKRKDLKRMKSIPADTLIREMLLSERGDTGRIYLLNIDNVQAQGPFNVLVHPIYQTNLCTEVMLPTTAFQRLDDEQGRIALCTLGSMNWGAVRHPDELRRACRLLVRALHNLLQYQDFLSIQSKKHNVEFEPLGIGITNLAYWHAKRKLKYGEAEALAEVKRWIEHQTFYVTQASVELAKEKGACEMSHTTCYGQGIFPWEKRAKGVDELTDFTPSDDLDWEGLRAMMKIYGIRNATLGAIAPVESSSVVLNSTNGIEMVKQLIVIKSSKAGEFPQVVPEYRKLKKHYQLLWDQKDCIDYIKTVAVLQAFIDQGISSNTFYSPKFFPEGKIPSTLVVKNLMLAHLWGLKSHYYHLVDKQGAMDSLKAGGPEIGELRLDIPLNTVVESEDEEYCESCVL